jgi:hypothetical protein
MLWRRHDVIKSSRAISRVRILEKHTKMSTRALSLSPDDGDRDSSRNVVLFKYLDAADSPRRFYYICDFRFVKT